METDFSAIDEPYKFLKIVPNSDGSVTRFELFPRLPPTPELTSESGREEPLALSKDITLNSENKTFIRLYRPVDNTRKLPVIIDFHAGGFVILSATSSPFHDTWTRASAFAPALVITVEYRLAPESRLPAPYDDAMEAIMWVRDQAREVNGCDPWMKELADYSNVHIMGTSAGGNIVYHAGLRVLDVDISPLQIKGLIINQPFFGGVVRTQSEEKLSKNPVLPLSVIDLFWNLSLPPGCDRDHEYSNPLKVANPEIERLPRCLVRGFELDPLVDRIKEFAKMLDAHGVKVVAKIEEGGCHGAEIIDQGKLQELFLQIKDFIYFE
ncbi:putative carboxylesterase 8 [Apium graveolens]|uniref:putative carboxylesterase 8 n=1 Tax=Apium graveolens TaxID=4045 RepID=UPI003D7AFAE1